MAFRKLLANLTFQVTDDNTKEIEFFLAALKRPEYLSKNNSFVKDRIKAKIKNTKLADALTAINTNLKTAFISDISQFRAGNEYYDELNDFWNNKHAYYLEFFDESSHEFIMTGDSLDQKFKDIDERLATTNSLPELIELFDNCELHLNFYQLIKSNDDLIKFFKNNKESSLVNAPEKIKHILTNCLKALVRAAHIYAQEKNQLNNDYFEPLESRFTQISFALEKLYLIKFFGDREETYLDLRNFIKTSYSTFHSAHLPKANDPLSLSHMPKLFSNDEKEILNELKNPEFQVIINMVKFPRSEIIPEIADNILDAHHWMYTKMVLDDSNFDSRLKFNFSLYFAYAQFDQATALTLTAMKKLENTPEVTPDIEKANASLSTISQFQSMANEDSHSWRKFNFIHFAFKTIKLLKSINVTDLQNAKEYAQAIQFHIEQGITGLWRSAHGEKQKPIKVIINTPLQPNVLEKDYYDLMVSQQYLLLVGELLLLMHRFKITAFNSPEVHAYIKKFTTPEQFKKIETHRLDGLFDIVLDKINALDDEMLKTGYLKKKPKFTKNSPFDADKHYQELLIENQNQEAKIREANTKGIKKKKLAYKDHVRKQTPKQSAFFKEEKLELSTLKPTPECALYFQAARVRQTGVPLENVIVLYEQIIKPYLENKVEPKANTDFFFTAASLSELADCYIRQALAATNNDFSHSNANLIPTIIKFYNQAITYAQLADECFVNHVVCLPTDSQKDFEDLARHIHDMLDYANRCLESMKESFSQLITNHEHARIQHIEARAAAIERFGGIEKWRKNTAPKNMYSDIRQKNSDELQKLLSSRHMIHHFITSKMTPVKNDFAYLTGKAPLPLLNGDPSEKSIQATNETLHGGGIFTERLVLLSSSVKLLKNGHDQKEALKLLIPVENKSALISENKEMENTSSFAP